MDYPRRCGGTGSAATSAHTACVGTDDETRFDSAGRRVRGPASARRQRRRRARFCDQMRGLLTRGGGSRQRPARGRGAKAATSVCARAAGTPAAAGLEHEAVHDRDGALALRARRAGSRPRCSATASSTPTASSTAASTCRAAATRRSARRPSTTATWPASAPTSSPWCRRSAPPGIRRSPAASTPTTRSSTACAASPTPATRPAPTSARSPASPSTPASAARPAPAASPPTRPSWRPRSWPRSLRAAGVAIPPQVALGERRRGAASRSRSSAPPPLTQIVNTTDVYSDNFFAEMLIKLLGARLRRRRHHRGRRRGGRGLRPRHRAPASTPSTAPA